MTKEQRKHKGKVVMKQLKDFVGRFYEDFHFFMDDKNERREIFDKWITFANEEAEDVQPYARLTVCSYIVKQALWGKDEEIAYYMTTAIEDIDFAQNREYDEVGNCYIPILHIAAERQRTFIGALVRKLTQNQVLVYLDAILDTHQGEMYCYALNSVLYALRAYVDLEEYEYSIQLGETMINIYENHEPDYGYFKHDTEGIVAKINIEIYRAHEKLGTATKEMIAALEESRKDPKEEERKRKIAEKEANRIALVNEAETCRTQGDEQGYCDKMSKASEENVVFYTQMNRLTDKCILDKVVECCKSVFTELERQKISTINNELLGHITSEAERIFQLALDGSYAMNFVVGTDEISSWKKKTTAYCDSKACYCLDITSDEDGCLKLGSSEAKFVFCEFGLEDVETYFSTFRELRLKVYDITNTYGELSKNSKKMPDVTRSKRGITYDFSFVFDNDGKLIYVRYCCDNENDERFDDGKWVDSAYDAGERKDYTLEAAEAYKRQFALEFIVNSYSARHTSLCVSNIYSTLYGKVSNEPALVEAYQWEYYASSTEYRAAINALKKMRDVKYEFPDVNYPDTNELNNEIRNLEPLAERQGWENHLR